MTRNKLTIIGCGLIGGSIGLALKRRRHDWTVAGLDLPERLPAIREAGVVDAVGAFPDDAADHLRDSAIVVLATPVQVILEQLEQIAPHLPDRAVVTDVGSTKTRIAELASRVIPSGAAFIGGHPIAGAECSGVESADALLFKDRVYVLCPAPNTPHQALLSLLDMVEDLLALPVTIEPEEHDQILAVVSHVPQLVAMALMHAALDVDASHKLLEVMAGPGFLDLTRLAAADFGVWASILQTNEQAIASALDRLEGSLRTVRQAMEREELADLWQRVSQQRRRLRSDGQRRMRRGDLRELIDSHDERILKALCDRLQVVRWIGRQKREQGAPVHDPDRERRLLQRRLDWGRSLDLPTDLVEELFQVLMKHAKELQTDPAR